MEHMNGHNVVDLGAPKKAKAGVNILAMARDLDEAGQYEVDVRLNPDGSGKLVPKRSQFVDAQELVEMIRAVVREEIARALQLAPDVL